MTTTQWRARVTEADPPVYFDTLSPEPRGDKPWLVMIHGGGHTGSCYLTTPDGRPGWAADLAARGFACAVPDWPGLGRSALVPQDALDGDVVCRGLGAVIEALDGPVVLMTHSMSGAYGWRLVETHGDRIRAVVAVAPAPPGNIQPEPEVIARGENFVEIQGVALRWRLPLDAPRVPDDQLVETKLIGAGTRFPRQTTGAYRAGLMAIPPRLIYQRQNVDGSQLRVNDVANFRNLPVFMVTGEHDIDHPRDVDGAIADWLAEIGADVEFRFLSDHGINGNGHMMMLEDNSTELAGQIADWLENALTTG